MSSDYYLLCLSHDPAIVISGDDLGLAVVTALRDREHPDLGRHRDCDIIAGRYSYPLIEVGCYGSQLPGWTACNLTHSILTWTDADWLRLLIASAGKVDDAVLRPFATRCWPLDRIRRLQTEL